MKSKIFALGLAAALLVAATSSATAATTKPRMEPLDAQIAAQAAATTEQRVQIANDAFASANALELLAGADARLQAPYADLGKPYTQLPAAWDPKAAEKQTALATSCNTAWYWMSLIEFITCKVK